MEQKLHWLNNAMVNIEESKKGLIKLLENMKI